MKRLILALAVPLTLTACDSSFQTKQDGNVVAASGAVDDHHITVDTPEFKASMKLPAMAFAHGDTDIDGMKLYPNTKLTGIDVNGTDAKDEDKVKLGFTSPDAPAKLTAYYDQAARDAGFTVATSLSTSITASKPGGKSFAIAMNPDGAGTKGTISISGD